MFSSMKDGFIKREDCPSSFELVAFQKGELSRGRGIEVRRHLEDCDFCDAEEEFYEHYQLVDSAIEPVPTIPAPLFELAEALLKGKHANGATLNALLKDGMVLDKV